MAPHARHLDLTTGLGLIVVGIMLTTLGPQFDGFVKGLCQGGGITMLLIGVVLISARWRRRMDDGDDSMWLPSRDESTR